MKYTLLMAAVVSLLASCHSFNGQANRDSGCNSKATCSIDAQNGQPYSQAAAKPAPSSQQELELQHGDSSSYPYSPSFKSHKQLADYASQMSMQLMETLHAFAPDAKVAVASFVELGSELEAGNIVGNQLAESFIHQMQQYGLSMVDYKTARDIRVTSQGDFVFSRQHQRLQTTQIIDYVLAGTMLHTPNGIMVNARMINFRSKVVAASAQQLIPYFVISALYPAAGI